MMNEREIYKKYLGFGVSQDPIRTAVIRAFCSVVRNDDHRDIWFKTMDDKTVGGVLDADDFAFWIEKKNKSMLALA